MVTYAWRGLHWHGVRHVVVPRLVTGLKVWALFLFFSRVCVCLGRGGGLEPGSAGRYRFQPLACRVVCAPAWGGARAAAMLTCVA